MYELGFTESAGAYQELDSEPGGVPGDPMIILVQSPWGPGAQAYDDGISSYVHLLAAGSPLNVDSALDATVIVHELTHAALARLNQCSVAWLFTQWAARHEGTADFFALAMLCDPAFDPTGVFAVFGYLADQMGWDYAHYWSLGMVYPYSADFYGKNALTLNDIDPGADRLPGV